MKHLPVFYAFHRYQKKQFLGGNMYKRGRNGKLSDMYCCECGAYMPIPRNPAEQREKGHMKTMWCFRCQKETLFKEVREKDFTLANVM